MNTILQRACLTAFALCLFFTDRTLAAEEATVVVTPRVERRADLPSPGVWPSFSGSVGGNAIRNCHTWGKGWKDFAERRALPAMKAVGKVWIHNPGGMVFGNDMQFDQFTRCRDTAALTGNEVLQRVSQWDEFTRQMSHVSERGDLVIYVGGPITFPLKENETDDEWFDRALEELKPLIDIRPPVTIGFDVMYGHPADPKIEKWHQWDRCGGPEGLHARLVNHLIDAGHEVLFEPGILAEATWAHDRVGMISNHSYWNKQLRGEDRRVPHGHQSWGRFLKPTEVTTRQFRYLQLLKDRTREEEIALINALVAAGYDAIVPWEKHPTRPDW